MDIVRLRTLTAKSTLGFGKDSDTPIRFMIDQHKQSYLRWVYFNASMISFTEEILNELKIDPEFRIAKPGTNPELNLKVREKLYGGISDSTREQWDKQLKKRLLARKIARDKTFRGCRAYLQSYNQGHKLGRRTKY
jgi:hypothetical protein